MRSSTIGGAVAAVLATLALSACVHPHPHHSGYDHDGRPAYGERPFATAPAPRSQDMSLGILKRNLRIGVSTQADVLRAMGSPNNVTLDSQGHEIWVYDRIHTEVGTSGYSDSAGANVGFGALGPGIGVGALFGGGHAHSRSNLVSSTKSLTVILEFDRDHVLRDMLAREGRY